MRKLARLGLLAVGVAVLGMSGVVRAEVSTNLAGSILVFPKVIANGSRDTIIQISNVSNSLVRAHCFYVNATLKDPTQPEGALNKRLWQEVDFDITLTKQQPTHWVVSQGRNVNPLDPVCDSMTNDCNDAGFDPGLIPPVVPDFEGELKCVEVDDSGAPLSGNHLKGEATLVVTSPGTTPGNEANEILQIGDLAQYNAIAILGSENNGDGTLVLGGGQCVGDGAANGQVCQADADCGDAAPCALEYNACPSAWTLNHFADGAPNPIIESVRLGVNHTEYPDSGTFRGLHPAHRGALHRELRDPAADVRDPAVPDLERVRVAVLRLDHGHLLGQLLLERSGCPVADISGNDSLRPAGNDVSADAHPQRQWDRVRLPDGGRDVAHGEDQRPGRALDQHGGGECVRRRGAHDAGHHHHPR